ncbi:hypothetical protein JCM10213_000567 [Rhodosporidiobolus nylandii]
MLAKDFVIFGYPIAKSKSPILHNTAFAYHNLPHAYRYIETPTLEREEVEKVLRSPAFGEIAISAFLDSITPTAKLLGAVNTVISSKREDGTVELVGENTDWIGILRELQAKLGGTYEARAGTAGMVLGAGGAGRAAVHALHEAGMSTIYLFNRTRSKAEDIVFSFPSTYNIVLLDNLNASSFNAGLPVAIVGTLPAKATTLDPEEANANTVFLPKDALLRPEGVVVIDMAYLPRETPLLRLTASLGTAQCKTATGLDVLLAQGFEQFRIWNGLEPPTELCREKVVEEYERENPV